MRWNFAKTMPCCWRERSCICWLCWVVYETFWWGKDPTFLVQFLYHILKMFNLCIQYSWYPILVYYTIHARYRKKLKKSIQHSKIPMLQITSHSVQFIMFQSNLHSTFQSPRFFPLPRSLRSQSRQRTMELVGCARASRLRAVLESLHLSPGFVHAAAAWGIGLWCWNSKLPLPKKMVAAKKNFDQKNTPSSNKFWRDGIFHEKILMIFMGETLEKKHTDCSSTSWYMWNMSRPCRRSPFQLSRSVRCGGCGLGRLWTAGADGNGVFVGGFFHMAVNKRSWLGQQQRLNEWNDLNIFSPWLSCFFSQMKRWWFSVPPTKNGGILVLDSEASGSDSDKSAQATRQNACRPKTFSWC